MATAQEIQNLLRTTQLAAKAKKAADADRSFTKFIGWVADGIVPLIDDGTLTQEQGEKAMRAVLRGITNGIAADKGWPGSSN